MKGVLHLSEHRNENRTQDAPSWGKLVIRLVLSAIVIAIAAFLTPGFQIRGLWGVIFAAVVISIVNYLIERFANIDASPFGRGIIGFIVAVFVLYISQFIITAMNVTLLGAILGAIVIGIIDVVIPGKTI